MCNVLQGLAESLYRGAFGNVSHHLSKLKEESLVCFEQCSTYPQGVCDFCQWGRYLDYGLKGRNVKN
jgi:hypothetical protein